MTITYLLMNLAGIARGRARDCGNRFENGDAYVIAETIRLNRMHKLRRGLP